jgi:hypothetical protein
MLQAGLPRKYGSIPIMETDLSIIQSVHTGSGTYPLSYSMGIRGSFSKGEWPGHEADHSPPTYCKVKNEKSYTSTSLYAWYEDEKVYLHFTFTVSLLYTWHFLLRCFKMNIQECPTVHIHPNT